MPDGPKDRLEQALLQVQSLIDSTVAIHRDRSLQETRITVVDGGYQAARDLMADLVAGASRTIDIVHARMPGAEREPAHSARAGRELVQGVQETVSVRLLTSQDLVDEEFVRAQQALDRPVEVRFARVPPLRAVFVDGEVGFVVAESAVGCRASMVRVPELVYTLHTLFESVWRNAVPAGERLLFDDRDRGGLTRRVLSSLCAGVTDEVAARDLGISIRTYRRHVAEIMALLGANCRFQAGARAVELGLLPRLAPRGNQLGRREA
ncbi:LuxR family transcriptional regulator [Streptomyces sp. tea 10]|nr:LuxR family transcriptional regulator [Streptomyces sp. tea 10]